MKYKPTYVYRGQDEEVHLEGDSLRMDRVMETVYGIFEMGVNIVGFDGPGFSMYFDKTSPVPNKAIGGRLTKFANYSK